MEYLVESYKELSTKYKNYIDTKKIDEISFSGEKRTLTKEQKQACHFHIHFHSAVCAGISAKVGEGCTSGADLAFIIPTELRMFKELSETLNTPFNAGIIHAGQHMFGAAMTGGRILKWLNSTAVNGGHFFGATLLPLITNGALTVYLRTSNAAL